MHALHRRRAAGFTLVELLVVIAILGVLTAIGTGAYFRVRTGQQVKTTQDTLGKLNAGLNRAWDAELTTAKEAFKGSGGMGGFSTAVDTTKTFAASDPDRAIALWNYLWMKNAFPQTFTEARASKTLTTGVVLQPRPTFADLPNTAPTSAKEAAEQSAVILYKILTQKGSRGETFADEAAGALSTQITVSGYSGRVFTDTFSNPVAFLPFAHGTEMDLPMRNAATSAVLTDGARSRDPFDPNGKLVGAWANKGTAQTNLLVTFAGVITDPPPAPATNTTIRWMYTVVSRGGNSDWTGFPTTAGIVMLPDDAGGLIYGYKLRRQGNRGDQ